MLERGDLEMGHARALLGLGGAVQVEAGRKIATGGLSVREAEALVRRLKGEQGDKPAKPKPEVDPNVRQLEQSLSERLGADVAIRHGAGGKGSLVIQYGSLDELDGILAHIK
jgi:ParB family chromosome partitioning protein